MATDFAPTDELPARGVIAPAFMALGIAAGVLDLYIDSRVLLWLGLGSGTIGLYFALYTRRLCALAVLRSPALPLAAMKAMNKRIDLSAAEARANRVREVQFRDFE
jgi:hypothetical protein